MTDVAYLECFAAQEALYWEARRRGWPLDDKEVGDILRLVAPILRAPDIAAINRLLATKADEEMDFGAMESYDAHKEFDDAWDALRARVDE